MTAITLGLSKDDATLVRLALLYLIRERKLAPAHAVQLPEADRAGFINDAADDVATLDRLAMDITLSLAEQREGAAIIARAYRDARATVLTAGECCEYHALHAANGGSAQLSADGHRQMAAEHSRVAFETSARYHAGQRA